jgi:hypothetical protein
VKERERERDRAALTDVDKQLLSFHLSLFPVDKWKNLEHNDAAVMSENDMCLARQQELSN